MNIRSRETYNAWLLATAIVVARPIMIQVRSVSVLQKRSGS